eukprot:3663033-Prymnesium_polylepis.1
MLAIFHDSKDVFVLNPKAGAKDIQKAAVAKGITAQSVPVKPLLPLRVRSHLSHTTRAPASDRRALSVPVPVSAGRAEGADWRRPRARGQGGHLDLLLVVPGRAGYQEADRSRQNRGSGPQAGGTARGAAPEARRDGARRGEQRGGSGAHGAAAARRAGGPRRVPPPQAQHPLCPGVSGSGRGCRRVSSR